MERLKSFHFAFKGIAKVTATQPNFRIHLAALILVIIAGFIFGISPVEWCIILLASALVMSLEIVNSAFEFLVDFISPEYHEKAGVIKDLAAAAVLIAAIFAAMTGIIIFGHHVLDLFTTSSAVI